MKKNDKDSLGDRIKTNYEGPACHYLTRRLPVIVRLDGWFSIPSRPTWSSPSINT